jgi:hypothetical protein
MRRYGPGDHPADADKMDMFRGEFAMAELRLIDFTRDLEG